MSTINTEPSSSKTEMTPYTPPQVWTWDNLDPDAMNRPTSGARMDQDLPVGKHPMQLYSLATPNGVKVTIMLEELLEAGYKGAEYDAWLIRISKNEQFGSGFVNVNPNSKIPALVDRSDGNNPIRVFESGSILLHLAETFDSTFLPRRGDDKSKHVETLNWLFWQMGSAPYVGGGFGHFYTYAPIKIRYAIDRYAMETKRQLDVLNKHLEFNMYMVGDAYTIADMAIWPWYGQLVLGKSYKGSDTFLQVQEYSHVIRWAKLIGERPAVQRGLKVNRVWGSPDEQLPERHNATDFDHIPSSGL